MESAKNEYSTSQGESLSRRGFMAGLGTLAAGAVVASMATKQAHADEQLSEVEDPYGVQIFKGVDLAMGHIVHLPDKCTGCRDCEIICSLAHWNTVNSELSAIRINTDILGGYISEAEICRQCPGAECMAVCPTGANYIDPTTGARTIDTEKCIGCQVCLEACPCTPSRVHFSSDREVCFKCDLCGGDPLCVKYCSNAALLRSWDEVEEDPNTFETDAGMPLTLSLTGAVMVNAPESIEVTDLNASLAKGGIAVTGTLTSTYSQKFDAVIKLSFFDADKQVLFFSDRSKLHMDTNVTESFEGVFETNAPEECKSIRIEIMCGKISG